jgi:hypothetical protein
VAFVAEPLSDANVSSLLITATAPNVSALLMTATTPIVATVGNTEVVEAPGSA